MLTVRVPSSAYFECTAYLAQNYQYPDREYYIAEEVGGYTISFGSADHYRAFCSRWSRVIL
jgi:hypothetical protein